MGFTLVEMLVVISIIAMLISLLVPSLKLAREQAKLVKCQSNMRQINIALLTYITEYDALPVYYVKDDDGCVGGWCTWSYGGWLGTNPYWDDHYGGVFKIPACERPLTKYMTKGEITPPMEVPGAGNHQSPLREIGGQPVFQCPSDTVSAQWQWRYHTYETAGVKLDYSAYDDVGTSYQMNFYWWQQTDKDPGLDRDGDGVIEPLPGECEKELILSCSREQRLDWPCRFRQGRQIWHKYTQRGASRFVTLGEDPFDYAIIENIQVMGFHRRFSQHNLAFLDGHVSYLRPDTRRMAGPHWTVLDEEMEEVTWP
jgi:prepilin-type N-terminal cleavage/methylation domain-containing protein/prepilin-type processing-associated H-X9-DG protein